MNKRHIWRNSVIDGRCFSSVIFLNPNFNGLRLYDPTSLDNLNARTKLHYFYLAKIVFCCLVVWLLVISSGQLAQLSESAL